MQLDPMVSLAHALYSRPGRYALLLGSGISRPASILTGWDIQKELLGRVRRLEGGSDDEDILAWYRAKFGTAPDYSRVIEALAPTAAERQALLQPFFEPNSSDVTSGSKTPTAAHKSIAWLLKKRYVRVVVTTNFDRLIEIAASEAGLQPTVVASEDQAAGMLPLIHQECLVVKVHGDYRDPTFLNTEDELRQYGPYMRRLLCDIFDSCGLIICGWSADWDRALRGALESITTRRFTTYWTTRHPLSPTAASVAKSRDAEIITITDADSFFGNVERKTAALESASTSHPLSLKVAAAESRRLMRDEADVLHLEQFVQAASERSRQALETATYAGDSPPYRLTSDEVWLSEIDKLLEELQVICIPAGRWARDRQVGVLRRVVERLSEPVLTKDGVPLPFESRWRVPSLLMLYTIGAAMAAGQQWVSLFKLLAELRVHNRDGEERSVYALHVDETRLFIASTLGRDGKLGASNWLLEKWHSIAAAEIPSEHTREQAFDRFELAMVIVYLAFQRAGSLRSMPGAIAIKDDGPVRALFGRYCWKSSLEGGERRFVDELKADVEFTRALRSSLPAWAPTMDMDGLYQLLEKWLIRCSEVCGFRGRRGI